MYSHSRMQNDEYVEFRVNIRSSIWGFVGITLGIALSVLWISTLWIFNHDSNLTLSNLLNKHKFSTSTDNNKSKTPQWIWFRLCHTPRRKDASKIIPFAILRAPYLKCSKDLLKWSHTFTKRWSDWLQNALDQVVWKEQVINQCNSVFYNVGSDNPYFM